MLDAWLERKQFEAKLLAAEVLAPLAGKKRRGTSRSRSLRYNRRAAGPDSFEAAFQRALRAQGGVSGDQAS